ncbi:MAG: SusE domain-containing protein, partial [Cytophagales bacterium]
MRNIIKIAAALSLAVLVNACLKEETTPQFSAPTNVEFAVTPSATTVAAAAKDSLTAALKLTWTDPKFSVGLKNSKFTVMVAKAGTNFSTFVSKEFTNALSGELTGKDLNGMATRFGASVGQPMSLDMKVVASLLNNNEPRSSAIFQVAVTPF